MRVLQTPHFKRQVKKLRPNQKADLDAAVEAIVRQPGIGEQKRGDLAWLRVHKCRINAQLWLIGYEADGMGTVVLHAIGSHENFYRDLKQQH